MRIGDLILWLGIRPLLVLSDLCSFSLATHVLLCPARNTVVLNLFCLDKVAGAQQSKETLKRRKR